MRTIDADALAGLLKHSAKSLKGIGGSKDVMKCFAYCINKIDSAPTIDYSEEISNLRAELARAERERAAAIKDMDCIAYQQDVMPCAVCRHESRAVLVDGKIDTTSPCFGCCELESRFSWRGTEVQP